MDMCVYAAEQKEGESSGPKKPRVTTSHNSQSKGTGNLQEGSSQNHDSPQDLVQVFRMLCLRHA